MTDQTAIADLLPKKRLALYLGRNMEHSRR